MYVKGCRILSEKSYDQWWLIIILQVATLTGRLNKSQDYLNWYWKQFIYLVICLVMYEVDSLLNSSTCKPIKPTYHTWNIFTNFDVIWHSLFSQY